MQIVFYFYSWDTPEIFVGLFLVTPGTKERLQEKDMPTCSNRGKAFSRGVYFTDYKIVGIVL
jgi:hypothetical protein